MRRSVATVVVIALALLCGCLAKVTVDKRPSLALPIYDTSFPSNSVVKEYAIVDQGYKVKYFKIGFNTDIENMQAELTTNKTVRFQLGGLHSFNSMTNSIDVKIDDLISIFKLFREATNDVIVIDKSVLNKN